MLSNHVIIVHGTCGSPSGNWFPWLERELASSHGAVSVPAFPTPEGQSFARWREVFLKVDNAPAESTILIGHSIGAPFVLRMAEEAKRPYKAIIAVCPFAKRLGVKEFDDLNSTFVERDFDWRRIKEGALHRLCFAGDDDPYVPLNFSKDVAKAIEAELIVVPRGGHLNAEFGYTAFPEILDALKGIL